MQFEESRHQQGQPPQPPSAATSAGGQGATPGEAAAAGRPAKGPPPLVLAPPPVQVQVRIAAPASQRALPHSAVPPPAISPEQLQPLGQPQPQQPPHGAGCYLQPPARSLPAAALQQQPQHVPAPASQHQQLAAGVDGGGGHAACNAKPCANGGGNAPKGPSPDAGGELPWWAPPPARHAAIHGAALAFNRASPGRGLEPAVIPSVTVAVEDVPWPSQQAHQLHRLEQVKRLEAAAAAQAQARQQAAHAGDGSPVSVGAPSAFSRGSVEEGSGASGAPMALDGSGAPEQPREDEGSKPMEGVALGAAGGVAQPPQLDAVQAQLGWAPEPVPAAPPPCADPRSPLHVPRTRLAVYDRFGRLLATLERYTELWDIPSGGQPCFFPAAAPPSSPVLVWG